MKVSQQILENAYWVCEQCGHKYGNGYRSSSSTWHEDPCDICDKVKPVTQFRDFGYEKRTYQSRQRID